MIPIIWFPVLMFTQPPPVYIPVPVQVPVYIQVPAPTEPQIMPNFTSSAIHQRI